MATTQTLEIPIAGMDCTECNQHVRQAIADLPGVEAVNVFLTSEKVVVRLDPTLVDLPLIHKAVESAGYSVPIPATPPPARPLADLTRPVLTLFGLVFGAVLFIVVVGEWLGLFEAITEQVPWPLGWVVVGVAGYPIFRNVVRAVLKGQITSHTLMSVGAVAALAVGEWATAAVVVFFMRVGDYAEHFTTERARRAVKNLTAMAPQMARLERADTEQEVPIEEVRIGEVVIVRPGEKIPVDGEVITGQATVDQATITGEAMPVEVGPGSHVFAATMAKLGSLRVRTTRIGADTTFGRVVKMVEEAEAHRAEVSTADILSLAASAERYSEHPLAEAVRAAARAQNLALAEPSRFEAVPGMGVRVNLNGNLITVGNRRMTPAAASLPLVSELEAQGKSLLFLSRDDELAGVLATADTLRPEVPATLATVRSGYARSNCSPAIMNRLLGR